MKYKYISVRHNKWYDTVWMRKVTPETMQNACRAARELDRPAVINATRPAMREFHEVTGETQKMQDTPVGQTFEIMGVPFRVIDRQPGCTVNGDVELDRVHAEPNALDHDFLQFSDFTLLHLVFSELTGWYLGAQ